MHDIINEKNFHQINGLHNSDPIKTHEKPEMPGKPNKPGIPEHPHKPEGPGKPNFPDKPQEIVIIVNTVPKRLPKGKITISYEEVIRLAMGNYDNSSIVIYTVDYFDGPLENKEGHLVKGHSVKICDGMVFSVGRSDKS